MNAKVSIKFLTVNHDRICDWTVLHSPLISYVAVAFHGGVFLASSKKISNFFSATYKSKFHDTQLPELEGIVRMVDSTVIVHKATYEQQIVVSRCRFASCTNQGLMQVACGRHPSPHHPALVEGVQQMLQLICKCILRCDDT